LAGSIVLSTVAFVGCESATVSPEAAAVLLTEKPAETISVTEVREKVEAGEPVEEVAVSAQIGGAPIPFIPEHAGFFVTTSAAAASHDHDHEGHDHDHEGEAHDHDHAAHDDEAHDHDHAAEEHSHDEEAHGHSHDHAGHDPSTCPFCKQGVDGKKNLALVKVLNAKGEVFTKSADKLLSLKAKQEVVVVGKPSLDPDGNLYIEATKIYVAQ
jgi:hypothetical protein